MQTYLKDPSAVLDFAWQWTSWLADAETISSHTVTVPTGITLGTHTESGGVVTAWISDGTDGADYRVACKIVTSAGRTDERSITIMVRDR